MPTHTERQHRQAGEAAHVTTSKADGGYCSKAQEGVNKLTNNAAGWTKTSHEVPSRHAPFFLIDQLQYDPCLCTAHNMRAENAACAALGHNAVMNCQPWPMPADTTELCNTTQHAGGKAHQQPNNLHARLMHLPTLRVVTGSQPGSRSYTIQAQPPPGSPYCWGGTTCMPAGPCGQAML